MNLEADPAKGAPTAGAGCLGVCSVMGLAVPLPFLNRRQEVRERETDRERECEGAVRKHGDPI